jgi:hypothetical protein
MSGNSLRVLIEAVVLSPVSEPVLDESTLTWTSAYPHPFGTYILLCAATSDALQSISHGLPGRLKLGDNAATFGCNKKNQLAICSTNPLDGVNKGF